MTQPRVGLARKLFEDRFAILSYVNAIAIDHARRRIFREDASDALQDAGFEEIVAVQPRPDVAVDMRKSFVQSVTLPVIGLAFPVAEVRFITANDLDTLIGAAAIDHDHFEVGIILREERTQRRLKIGALIEGWRNDADFHAPTPLRCRARISSNQPR